MWIRFSGEDAIRTGDGLYAASSGNPSLPAWLGKPLFDLFFTPKGENDKYAKHVRSSAGIAIFVADEASPCPMDRGGARLRALCPPVGGAGTTQRGSEPACEVPALRPQFASFLGIGLRRPDLVVRFGRGPRLPPSLRRPVQTVLV